MQNHKRIQKGDGVHPPPRPPPPPPLTNHKNIGFLSITGPDPLENHKATKPEFNVGPSFGMPANAGGPMMASLKCNFLSSLAPHQIKKKRCLCFSMLDPL